MTQMNMIHITLVCFLSASLLSQSCAKKEPAVTSSAPKVTRNNYVKAGLIQAGEALPKLTYYNLQCVDGQRCWINDNLNIYRTENQGKDWEHIFTASNDAEIQGLFFSSSQTCSRWNKKEYFTSNDGGRNWTAHQLPSVNILNGRLEGLFISADGKSRYLFGGIYVPLTVKERQHGGYSPIYMSLDRKSVLRTVLYYTHDQGASWKLLSLPSLVGTVDSISLISEKNAIVIVDRAVFFAEDYQKEWILSTFKKSCVKDSFLGPDYNGKPASLFFLNQSVGWLGFNDGRVCKTTDSGKTWCDITLPGEVKFDSENSGETGFVQLVFLDELNGWGLGNTGKLYRTRDAGKKWEGLYKEMVFDDMELVGKKNLLLINKDGLFVVEPEK